MKRRKKKVLAIASGGGHWIQLNRLRPSWKNLDVVYASTMRGAKQSLLNDALLSGENTVRYVNLPEANQWQKFRLLLLVIKIAVLVLRVRPDFVITTGAAHGYLAIRFAKLLGAKTIWIDSIANAEEMSGSGRMIQPYADICLTQWPHIAKANDGPRYEGSVL